MGQINHSLCGLNYILDQVKELFSKIFAIIYARMNKVKLTCTHQKGQALTLAAWISRSSTFIWADKGFSIQTKNKSDLSKAKL
jgi:hypothetical protein